MKYTADHPSPAYRKALAEAQDWHRRSKTWSGLLMSPHVDRIKELLVRTGAASMLDYGCGKLMQYREPAPDGRSVDEYLAVPIDKVDPAVPADFLLPPGVTERIPVATTLPEGKTWDVVVVTHVLGTIPRVDLQDWVMPLLHRSAKKAIFIAEQLGEAKKRVFSDPNEIPRTAEEWMELIGHSHAGVEIDAWFRDAGAERFQRWGA